MTLTAYTLTLAPAAPDEPIRHWYGRAAQAWLLEMVRKADPALAAHLHGQPGQHTRRPYTLCPPLPWERQHPPTLRVTSLSAALSAVLHDQLPTVRTMRLGKLEVPVLSTTLEQHITLPQLVETVFAAPLTDGGLPAMTFRTPTAFHSAGLNVPMPLPTLVFGSLVNAWAALDTAPLPVPIKDFVAQCISVAQLRIRTRLLTISTTDTRTEAHVGFMGTVQWHLQPQAKSGLTPDDYQLRQRVLWLFSTIAPYSGVGIRTTIGMGQVSCSLPFPIG